MAAPNVVGVPKKKSAVSAPMIYALLIVIGAAIYLNLPNQNSSGSTTAKRRSTTTTVAGADVDGITAADYSAHFPRYPGSARNPYVPGILSASQQSASASGLLGGMGGPGGKAGSWALTGVNIIDGVASALIESASGDSVTLRKGDQWHGLKVVGLSSDAVTFQNDLGQTSQLGFDSETTNGGASPNAPNVPSLSQIRPLPPLTINSQTTAPVVSNTATPSFGAAFRTRGRSSGGNSNNNSNQNNNTDNGPPDDGGGPPPGGFGGGGFGGPPG